MKTEDIFSILFIIKAFLSLRHRNFCYFNERGIFTKFSKQHKTFSVQKFLIYFLYGMEWRHETVSLAMFLGIYTMFVMSEFALTNHFPDWLIQIVVLILFKTYHVFLQQEFVLISNIFFIILFQTWNSAWTRNAEKKCGLHYFFYLKWV